MTEADIEVLVSDALAKGLHKEAGRRKDEPLMRPFKLYGFPIGKPQFPELLLVSLYGSSQYPTIRIHAE
jgi:hypothetical protein